MKSESLKICRGMGKEVPANSTQRIVLTLVSSVFDPLGLSFPLSENEIVAQRNLEKA